LTVVLAAQDLEQSLHPNRPTRKLGEHPASGVRGWHGFMDIGTYVRWLYESLDAVLSAQPWGEVVLSGGHVVIDPADEGPDEIDPRLIAAIETAVVKLAEIIEAEAPAADLPAGDAIEAAATEGSNGAEQLPKRVEQAYLAHKLAVDRIGGDPSDREAYDWLEENGPDEYGLPPSFDTWARYVRRAREHYSTQKNSPRHGREAPSVVSHKQIDSPRKQR